MSSLLEKNAKNMGKIKDKNKTVRRCVKHQELKYIFQGCFLSKHLPRQQFHGIKTFHTVFRDYHNVPIQKGPGSYNKVLFLPIPLRFYLFIFKILKWNWGGGGSCRSCPKIQHFLQSSDFTFWAFCTSLLQGICSVAVDGASHLKQSSLFYKH